MVDGILIETLCGLKIFVSVGFAVVSERALVNAAPDVGEKAECDPLYLGIRRILPRVVVAELLR